MVGRSRRLCLQVVEVVRVVAVRIPGDDRGGPGVVRGGLRVREPGDLASKAAVRIVHGQEDLAGRAACGRAGRSGIYDVLVFRWLGRLARFREPGEALECQVMPRPDV